MKTKAAETSKGPVDVVKEGSIGVPIYRTWNRIYRPDPRTGEVPRDGHGAKVPSATHPQFTLVYYDGTRRVRRKFTSLARAQQEALSVAVKLANGESEALKLNGLDRSRYVCAIQKLRELSQPPDLGLAVAEYVGARRRLPDAVSLGEVVTFYLKRHPIGLPQVSVREVVDELLKAKEAAGRSDVYLKDIRCRLGQFAEAFHVPIATVSGKQVADWIAGLGLSGRSQNNFRRMIGLAFSFAKRRGYLPKDHDELDAVELAEADSSDPEIFTPDELRRLFAAAYTPVKERGVFRVRVELVPYLALTAFCGIRAAETARLDWSEVHLHGAERYVELKAGKAKTGSRRLIPIPDNAVAWLLPHAQAGGLVCPFERMDKQCFERLGPTAGVPWKRNGLRHSFISYRVALTKNVHQVSLEAGNSPQMIFAHYLRLATESQAKEWFSIAPSEAQGRIIAMPSPARSSDADKPPTDTVAPTGPGLATAAAH